MTDTRDDDALLERFFDAGRQEAAPPSAEFMARLEADADAHLPMPPARSARPIRRRRLFEGWGLAVSLASTVAVGVAIGVVLPETLLVTEDDAALTAILPGYGASLLAEGL